MKTCLFMYVMTIAFSIAAMFCFFTQWKTETINVGWLLFVFAFISKQCATSLYITIFGKAPS